MARPDSEEAKCSDEELLYPAALSHQRFQSREVLLSCSVQHQLWTSFHVEASQDGQGARESCLPLPQHTMPLPRGHLWPLSSGCLCVSRGMGAASAPLLPTPPEEAWGIPGRYWDGDRQERPCSPSLPCSPLPPQRIGNLEAECRSPDSRLAPRVML